MPILQRRMRLDVYLSENGYVSTRTRAKALISEGVVKVAGKVVTKPAFDISGFESLIQVEKSELLYVSRGGLKLAHAIKHFKVEVEGRVCLDIGASSGGFTDCLLKSGAECVVAVDSGTAQMVTELAEDKRVTLIENYNARYMKPEDFDVTPTLAVMDVSFISATYIIPPLSMCLSSGAEFILLIKPQFEVGKNNLGKGGIVKDEKLRKFAINRVVDNAESCGFSLVSLIESPILGGDGNTEYLAYFKKV